MQAPHPGAGELMLLSSSRLSSSCQCRPQVLLLSRSLLGLVSSLLSSSRVVLSPILIRLLGATRLGAAPVGPSRVGLLPGHLRPAASECPFPRGACLSWLLPGSGPTGRANRHSGCPALLSVRGTVSRALSLHVPLALQPSLRLPLGASRAPLGSHSQVTGHALSGFLPSLPFRVWSFLFIQRA